MVFTDDATSTASSNVTSTHYRVIQAHHSEYPEPITFSKGARLTVGEAYDGPEGWDHWLLCAIPGQQAGWVPEQLLDVASDATAYAKEDYTARELNVQIGEQLSGSRIVNGWLWCESPSRAESGWVPLANLEATSI